MNIIQLMGRLGADPEVRFTQAGLKVTTFRMATNSRRGGKEETTWWRVTVWGDRFDKMMSYLKKGSAVIVIGEMKPPEMYTDRNGETRVSLEVTANSLFFSPFKTERSEEAQQGNAYAPQQQQAPAAAEAPQASFSGGGGESFYGSNDQSPPPQGSNTGDFQEGNVTEDDLPF